MRGERRRPRVEEVLRTAVRVEMGPAHRLIQGDPHQWSERLYLPRRPVAVVPRRWEGQASAVGDVPRTEPRSSCAPGCRLGRRAMSRSRGTSWWRFQFFDHRWIAPEMIVGSLSNSTWWRTSATSTSSPSSSLAFSSSGVVLRIRIHNPSCGWGRQYLQSERGFCRGGSRSRTPRGPAARGRGRGGHNPACNGVGGASTGRGAGPAPRREPGG